MARPERVAVDLVKAALELHRRRLWLEVPGDAPFLVRVPGVDDLLVVSILGHEGQEHGLYVARGEHAFAATLRLFMDDNAGADELSDAWILGLTVQPLGSIEPQLRTLVETAQFQGRREGLAPLALSQPPRCRPRGAHRGEMKLLLSIARAVLAAHDTGELRPESLDHRRRRILQIELQDEPALIRDVRVTTRLVSWPATGAAPRAFKSPLRLIGDAPAAIPWESSRLPQTLDEWKLADRVVTSRLVQEVQESGALTSRALARFFGSHKLAQEVFKEFARFSPLAGVMEWLYVDYRATRKSPTFLERRLLQREASATDQALFEGRQNARLSIYRVDRTVPAATLEVEDVLSGERVTIQDRELSACDVQGYYLPMRLMRVGSWVFCAVSGPPLNALRADEALDYLERLGAELTPTGLRRSAHLVGRLWEFSLERKQRPIIVCNTDGERMELQSASFTVAGTGALQAHLSARADLLREKEDHWQWWRPGGPTPGFGDTTILGRLQIVGDRLVLDVNSKGRLARARRWLERIPGVRFERVTQRELSDLPLDDRLPSPSEPGLDPSDPQVRRLLEQTQRQLLRSWLDERVPALGHQTPRAACATPEGRRRVARMIRTMPPMSVPGGSIAAPREELLRELGLDAED